MCALWRRALKEAGKLCTSCRVVARRPYVTGGKSRDPIAVHPAVADALAAGRPVVALETTIVTHGMPYPQNLDTAQEVENIVRQHGATPATIGVLDGQIFIGLTRPQLERLATAVEEEEGEGERCVKVSRRDLPFVLSQGLCGGTTVSATMVCAHKAGIPVFVTGGIGGVHRHGEHTMDISADLTELGRRPVGVICSGVKSILDIGRTLEYLETQGVAVATYGDGDEFPAFFSHSSGCKSPHSIRTPGEGARLVDSLLSLGLDSGALIAVPIPEAFRNLGNEIEQATHQALSDAAVAGVTGKAVTPFVLQRINELTAGRSLEANIALMKNNAVVGSQIAVELASLRRGQRSQQLFTATTHAQKRPVVIGASNVDLTAKITSNHIKSEGTNPGSLTQSFGGVGRNIAECMARLGTPPLFISAVGKDAYGAMIKRHLEDCGMETHAVLECGNVPSSTYCVVLDHRGETHCGVGDMAISSHLTYDWVKQFSQELSEASTVCLDGNLPASVIQRVTQFCHSARVPVWYEPTCVDKAVKPIQVDVLSKLSYVSPNLSELRAMHAAAFGTAPTAPHSAAMTTTDERISLSVELCKPLLYKIPNILVSLGSAGLLYARRQQHSNGGVDSESHVDTGSCGLAVNTETALAGLSENVEVASQEQGMLFQHYQPAADHLLPVAVISVTGAGDSFVGGVMASLTRMNSGLSLEEAVKVGLRVAHLSLLSPDAISPLLNPDFLMKENIRLWSPWKPKTLTL